MSFATWLVFLASSLLTTFSPGPAILLAISNSLAFGARKAFFSSAGNIAGIFMVSSAAMIGLGVVLNASAMWFNIFKTVGAAYLIYLGWRQWTSRVNLFDSPLQPASQSSQSDLRLFRQGVLVAVTNPKSILFFTALFPQFINPGVPMVGQFLILTTTFAASAVIAHSSYVLLTRQLRGWFSIPGRVKLFNRCAGAAFVLLGASVLRLARQVR